MLPKLFILYTTIDSLAKAEALAEQAVKEKLAACVNIIPGMQAIYEWEGKLEKSDELVVLFKTSEKKIERLKQWLVENHPYETPAILTWGADTSDDYYTHTT